MVYPKVQPPIEYNPNRFGYRFLDKVSGQPVYHPGVDLNWGDTGTADEGLDMAAPADGVIVYSRNAGPGWGNLVVIHHEELDRWSRIAHWQKVYISVGDTVQKGQVIGKLGKSGTSSPHCHWEVHKYPQSNWAMYPNYWTKEQVMNAWEDPLEWVEDVNDMYSKDQEISEWAVESMAKAKEVGIITNQEDPKDAMSQENIEWMFNKLGLRKNRQGVISKEAWSVILDKLELLDTKKNFN